MADFSRLKAELKRQWVVWVVLFFSGGMKAIVNQVEQPFARSLVACDEPVLNATFTGSEWCGDRLKVLQDGYFISQQGQAQESFAMLCSLTGVAVLAGAFGRKLVVVIGLFGMTASVVLFVIASTNPAWGRSLFAYGQGLQGLYPLDYIQGMVVLDMSMQVGGDGQSTFELAAAKDTASNFLWALCLGNLVQVLELTRYRHVWLMILALNIAVLALAAFAFPETLVRKKASVLPEEIAEKKAEDEATKKDKLLEKPETPEEEVSAAMKVFKEVSSYASLIKDYRARRYLACKFFEGAFAGPFIGGMLPVQLMAFHGWSQTSMVLLFFTWQPLSIMCLPIYGKIQNVFGFKKTYIFGIFSISGALWLMCLGISLPHGDKLAVLGLLYVAAMSGWNGMRGFVDSRFCEQDQVARFVNAQWILGYFEGMIIGPLYASLFNPWGQSYLERARPNILMVFMHAINLTMIFTVIYRMEDNTEGFAVTLEQLDSGSSLVERIFEALLSKRPLLGKIVPNGPQVHHQLNEELWKELGFDEVFWGKSAGELGGPFWDKGHLGMAITQFNTGPKAMAHVLEKLELALEKAKTWAALPEAAGTEQAPEGKKAA